MAIPITPLVLTYNEEANLERTLGQLRWAEEVVVLDSFSTDRTVEIAQRFPNVRVEQRRFDTFAAQCNFGLGLIRTEWALSLDADYLLSGILIDELLQLSPPPTVAGYQVSFRYCIAGEPIRGSLYPPRTVLYRRHLATYRDEGHGHRVQVDGSIQRLRGKIDHDDRKPLSRWLTEQTRYMVREAAALRTGNGRDLTFPDRLRRWCIPAPLLVLLYTLFFKGLVLDGWRGWFYACQRTYAEFLLLLHLLDAKFAATESTSGNDEHAGRQEP